MESEEQQPSKEFVRGFNDAYILAAHEPVLLSDMSRSLNPTNDFFEGFFAGKDQWQIEQEKSNERELSALRNRSKERERDSDKER